MTSNAIKQTEQLDLAGFFTLLPGGVSFRGGFCYCPPTSKHEDSIGTERGVVTYPKLEVTGVVINTADSLFFLGYTLLLARVDLEDNNYFIVKTVSFCLFIYCLIHKFFDVLYFIIIYHYIVSTYSIMQQLLHTVV
jgi:hypothetical protein